MLSEQYVNKLDWRVKENANTCFSLSGLSNYVAGNVLAKEALAQIPHAETHLRGELHIHDLGNGLYSPYCCGHDLRLLLLNGLKTPTVSCRPARHFDTVVDHIANYLICTQNEWAGAQAFSNVDTFLAPYIRYDKLDYKAVKQGIQRIFFNLNFPTRSAYQSPFVNFTFDWVVPEHLASQPVAHAGELKSAVYADFKQEMDMINKAVLEMYLEGDANGKPWTFPLPTYNLTNDVLFEDGDNQDLLWQVTAKFGSPYFFNYLGTNLKCNSVRAMCCRLNLDLSRLPRGWWNIGVNTGSLAVVTINLNRIGIEAKDESEYFDLLEKRLEIAKEILLFRRAKIIEGYNKGLLPITSKYIASFSSFYLTIGICGMAESLANFRGTNIWEEQDFVIRVLQFIRRKIEQFEAETGLLFNLEQTPAEGASHRLAKLDKKYYPDCIVRGDIDRWYLTNSTHVPVDAPLGIVDQIKYREQTDPLYTGGTMLHIYLDEYPDPGGLKSFVQKLARRNIPYFSITPTFSICSTHGFIAGAHPVCPTCKMETEIYSRVVGYYRPIKNFNPGQLKQFWDRKYFMEGGRFC